MSPNGGVASALAAPADDLSNDGTQPPPPPPPDPGPGTFDNLSSDGTQPPPPPPPDPGPGAFDDLSGDGTQPPPPPPPDPVPGSPDDLSSETAPPPPAPAVPATAPAPGASPGAGAPGAPPPPAITPIPAPRAPRSSRPHRPSVTLAAARRVARRSLRKGVVVRLTVKAPVHVVVTLRGPGSARRLRRMTLPAGTRKLTLRPGAARSAGKARTLTVVVTATGSDGGRVTLRRTIRISG